MLKDKTRSWKWLPRNHLHVRACTPRMLWSMLTSRLLRFDWSYQHINARQCKLRIHTVSSWLHLDCQQLVVACSQTPGLRRCMLFGGGRRRVTAPSATVATPMHSVQVLNQTNGLIELSLPAPAPSSPNRQCHRCRSEPDIRASIVTECWANNCKPKHPLHGLGPLRLGCSTHGACAWCQQVQQLAQLASQQSQLRSLLLRPHMATRRRRVWRCLRRQLQLRALTQRCAYATCCRHSAGRPHGITGHQQWASPLCPLEQPEHCIPACHQLKYSQTSIASPPSGCLADAVTVVDVSLCPCQRRC